jgi:hypothetical protein
MPKVNKQSLILLTLLSLNLVAQFALADSDAQFYIAPDGNDAWSGTLAAPNAGKSDGPLAKTAPVPTICKKIW